MLSINGVKKELHPITYFGVGTPKLDDVARACDAGYAGRSLRVWDACPQCGKERWQYIRFKGKLCPECGSPKGGQHRRSINNGNWSGGKRYAEGYIFITVDENHPFFSMAKKATNANHFEIAEHRLVMAQHLGRVLTDDELVHHINGNRSDNRIENLQLLRYNQHHAFLVLDELQNRYRILEARVTLLEAENILLKSQLEGRLIPNQAENEDSFLGVCRDLTGSILKSDIG